MIFYSEYTVLSFNIYRKSPTIKRIKSELLAWNDTSAVEIPLEWNQPEAFEVLHAEYSTCWFYFNNLLLANSDFLYSQTVMKIETSIEKLVLNMHVDGSYYRQCTMAEYI